VRRLAFFAAARIGARALAVVTGWTFTHRRRRVFARLAADKGDGCFARRVVREDVPGA
jgi:hypothetical protein